MSVQTGWFLQSVCTESCILLKIIFGAVFENTRDCNRHAVLTFSNSRKLRFAYVSKLTHMLLLLSADLKENLDYRLLSKSTDEVNVSWNGGSRSGLQGQHTESTSNSKSRF
jgi:hypothetical protein